MNLLTRAMSPSDCDGAESVQSSIRRTAEASLRFIKYSPPTRLGRHNGINRKAHAISSKANVGGAGYGQRKFFSNLTCHDQTTARLFLRHVLVNPSHVVEKLAESLVPPL